MAYRAGLYKIRGKKRHTAVLLLRSDTETNWRDGANMINCHRYVSPRCLGTVFRLCHHNPHAPLDASQGSQHMLVFFRPYPSCDLYHLLATTTTHASKSLSTNRLILGTTIHPFRFIFKTKLAQANFFGDLQNGFRLIGTRMVTEKKEEKLRGGRPKGITALRSAWG
jgi:hypothetical protein